MQLNGIRTPNFQLKLFDIAVTLKYGQGQWKLYYQVKLNELYQHAKCDICHIYGVRVNPNVIVFDKPRHLTDEKHVNYLPWIHTKVTQIILCIIFFMHVATILRLNYRGQESKTCNLQFMILKRLWPWNKVKVSKPEMKMYNPN